MQALATSPATPNAGGVQADAVIDGAQTVEQQFTDRFVEQWVMRSGIMSMLLQQTMSQMFDNLNR